MKRYFSILLLGFSLFALPAHAGGGGGLKSSNVQTISTGTNIPSEILHYVLEQAAPHYGLSGADMIRAYYNCECITVLQIAKLKFYVEMGGLGIEILIDVSKDTREVGPTRK